MALRNVESHFSSQGKLAGAKAETQSQSNDKDYYLSLNLNQKTWNCSCPAVHPCKHLASLCNLLRSANFENVVEDGAPPISSEEAAILRTPAQLQGKPLAETVLHHSPSQVSLTNERIEALVDKK